MKKEFMIYKNKAPLDSIENNDEYKGKKLDVILDEEIEKKCGKFELTATQKFLKRFLNLEIHIVVCYYFMELVLVKKLFRRINC